MLAAFLSNRAVISTVWLPAATPPRDLHVGRGAAVLVRGTDRWAIGGRHAVHGDGDLAAVGVQERAEVEIVLLRGYEYRIVTLRTSARSFGRGALRVPLAPPLRGPADRAVLVVLPKAGVLAPRVGFLDPLRIAAHLQAARRR